jgi:PncC family amidohydrolase
MKNNIYSVAERLGRILKEKRLKIAVAESCTGGLLSSFLTDIPGSSQYFVLGLVVYSSLEKQRLLKIKPEIIQEYSSVSEKVSELMARNIAAQTGSDLGIGITGFAGPNRGDKQTPAGTVYLCLSYGENTYNLKECFSGSRKEVKQKSVEAALELILNKVL